MSEPSATARRDQNNAGEKCPSDQNSALEAAFQGFFSEHGAIEHDQYCTLVAANGGRRS
jgi:hypothetical protein